MLLNLYETKLNMLDNPKKKSKMWISMSEELKPFGIEVNPYFFAFPFRRESFFSESQNER